MRKPSAMPSSSFASSSEKVAADFMRFTNENPTIFHVVTSTAHELLDAGFTELSEKSVWCSPSSACATSTSCRSVAGGKYFVIRNRSSLIAFTVGDDFPTSPTKPMAIIAGHADVITAKLKPCSKKSPNAAECIQLGVAQYAGGLNQTWWDRDLGIGGRVLVQNDDGKVEQMLVKLDWPIARIPTLAPHFGVGIFGENNPESQAVPVIGLRSAHPIKKEEVVPEGGRDMAKKFTSSQPPELVELITNALDVNEDNIVNWELELFDTQPAQLGGMANEFLFSPRLDDRLCCWTSGQAFIESSKDTRGAATKVFAMFDNEEISSLTRQGARGNFMPSVLGRILECFADKDDKSNTQNLMGASMANSFLLSADVIHAYNPNFLGDQLVDHAPLLNVGIAVSSDSNGHMSTDAISTAFIAKVAKLSGNVLQSFQIRNDRRSGGTIGPMMSSALGVRAVDIGIPQWSMHSIRATTGAKDPELGCRLFKAFYDHFECVQEDFSA